MISALYAQAAGQTTKPGGSFMGSLIMIALIFIVFYLLLILPAKKRQKKHQELVNSIEVGDGVVTAGGIVGKVTTVYEDRIEVDSKGTKFEVIKNYVTNVTKKR